MKIGYQAIGHFGTRLFLKDPNKHPRKQLLEAMGRKHCNKIYVDSLNGPKHIGYIVAREWFTIKEIHNWEG